MSRMRKIVLASGEIYHIYSRSIANFVIFNNEEEYERMLKLVTYYQIENNIKFSAYLELQNVQQNGFFNTINNLKDSENYTIQIIAYCLMPTHIHLVLRQLGENGISNFMHKVLDGYTRYFNTIHKRKGPLWESRFKNVLVDNDDQLKHLVRYLHLNPVTSYLVDKPDNWNYSSYNEYINPTCNITICKFENIFKIAPIQYQKFVNDQISYQRELSNIKRLIIE